MKEIENKKDLSNAKMDDDLLLITDILEKYAQSKDDKDAIKEVRNVIDRFNNLSRKGKLTLMSDFIWRIGGFALDVNDESCTEYGHAFTKWRRVSYTKFGLLRAPFAEQFGSEYAYFRDCKTCGEQEIISEDEYRELKAKRKQLKRDE